MYLYNFSLCCLPSLFVFVYVCAQRPKGLLHLNKIMSNVYLSACKVHVFDYYMQFPNQTFYHQNVFDYYRRPDKVGFANNSETISLFL